MAEKNFYITTPIYYVNDVPHIGHAYTTIAADVLNRWHKSGGENSYFLTGTDEHGQKIQTVAEKKGITPIELCDQVVQNFQRLWDVLNVKNDDFIRTTQPRHEKVVQEIFRRLIASDPRELGYRELLLLYAEYRFLLRYALPDGSFRYSAALARWLGLVSRLSGAVSSLQADAFFAMVRAADRLVESGFGKIVSIFFRGFFL